MRRGLVLLTLSVGLGSSAGAIADSAGFTLDTGSPDALCPDLALAREAVARRLGSLVVEGRRGWRARYTIAHAPSGNPRDFVRLELFDPEGGLELSRDLPMRGESCRTMAEVIALVLDRHFRGLVTERDSEPDAEDEAPRSPAPAATRAPIAPTERAPQPPMTSSSPAVPSIAPTVANDFESASAVRSPFARARVMAGFSERLPDAMPSAVLRGWVPVVRPLQIGVALELGLKRDEEALAAHAVVRAAGAGARAFVAWVTNSRSWSVHIGPALGVRGEHGTSTGLPMNTDSVRAIWSGGLDGGVGLALDPHLFVACSASLDVRVPGASGRFFVDDREVLARSPVSFAWSLGVGYALFH